MKSIMLAILLLPRAAFGISTSDYNAIQAHLNKASNLTGHAQQLEMNLAIRLTLHAYGLLPTQNGQLQIPTGVSQVDGFKQQGHRQWLFTYDASLKNTFSVNDIYGPIRDLPGPTADAMTAPNGMSVFWVDPAKINPNGLAFLVDHELEHFKSFVTPGIGNLPVPKQEIDIYTLQQGNLGKYGYVPHPQGLYGPYENAASLCTTLIARNSKALAEASKPIARARAAIQAWRHRNGTPVYAHGRAVFVDNEKLEQIRRDAEALDVSIRVSEARRRQDLTPPPIAPAPPAALSVEEARRSYPTAAPETADVARTSFGRMVDAACDSDWASVSVDAYPRLTGEDLAMLDARALQLRGGCYRKLLERLIAMRRSGVALDVDRLRAEVIAAQSSGNSSEVNEPESRKDERPGTGYNPCINDGNTCLRR